MMRDRPSRTIRGFTLIEMTVALAVSSIVLVALGSVVVLSSRALPDANDRGTRAGEVERAMDQIAEDLATAKRVSMLSTGFLLTLPDRDNSGTDDTAAYWYFAPTEQIVGMDESGVQYVLLSGVQAWNINMVTDAGRLKRVKGSVTLVEGLTDPVGLVVETLNRPGVQ